MGMNAGCPDGTDHHSEMTLRAFWPFEEDVRRTLAIHAELAASISPNLPEG